MRHLAHSLIFYLRFNPWRIIICAALLCAFLVIVAQQTGIAAPRHGVIFWGKYVALAQAGLAVSLAYVALPYFRHNKAMEEKSCKLIGKSRDERIAFIKAILARPQDENDTRPELMAVTSIVDLLESLACSWRGEVMPRAPEQKDGIKLGSFNALNQVSHFHKEAARVKAIATDGALKRWLNTYFPGGDLVIVLTGVAIASLVLALALIEQIVPLSPTTALSNTVAQLGFGVVLLIWTTFVPAFYAYYSNRVSHTVKDFFAKADDQKSEFDALKSDETETALANIPKA